MSEPFITQAERAAFAPDIARGVALEHLYRAGNVPFFYAYRDRMQHPELTATERRNKKITETLWLGAYQEYLVANIPYRYLYRGRVLQLILQAPQIGGGRFAPAPAESRAFVATAEEVSARFETWLGGEGWQIADELRQQPATDSWRTLLQVPDRAVRIVSCTAVGNQVVVELVTSWSEDHQLREAAWVAVLIYDDDGTVLQDRSYIDLDHWPSTSRLAERGRLAGMQSDPHPGAIAAFFEFHRRHARGGSRTVREARNTGIAEQRWLDAFEGGDDSVLHPERFRLQLPLQKCVCSRAVAREINASHRDCQARTRLMRSYAKADEVALEGIVEWLQDDHRHQGAFIVFLRFDDAGLIVRERRYMVLVNWPGGPRIGSRLGIG